MAKSISITFKLVPGIDDDLINWLDGIQGGKRSPAIRDRLRGTTPQVPGLEGVRSEIAQLREAIMRGNWQPSAAPQVEAAPRLDQEQIEQRTQKLKKAKW